MDILAPDTLAICKSLIKEGGFSQKQAEAITDAIATGQANKIDRHDLANLATRADIARLEQATKADIARLEQRLSRLELSTKEDISRLEGRIEKVAKEGETSIARLEASLIKWMLGLIIGLGAFLSALIIGVSGKFPV